MYTRSCPVPISYGPTPVNTVWPSVAVNSVRLVLIIVPDPPPPTLLITPVDGLIVIVVPSTFTPPNIVVVAIGSVYSSGVPVYPSTSARTAVPTATPVVSVKLVVLVSVYALGNCLTPSRYTRSCPAPIVYAPTPVNTV